MFQEEISIHNPFIIMRKIDFSNSFLGRKKNIQMYIPQVNLESQTNGSLTLKQPNLQSKFRESN